MTGKEFLEFYEQINEITGIEWDIVDDLATEYTMRLVFTIDGERLSFNYPHPLHSIEEREMNYIAISMLVNKCIRDMTGQDATMFNVHGEGIAAASTITAYINYARHLFRERNSK